MVWAQRSERHGQIRVLWVNDHLGYPNGIVHGAAQLFRNVLPSFDPERVHVELGILGPQHPFAEDMCRVGIRPIFLHRAKWDPLSLWDLIRLVRQHQIHILHLQGLKGMMLGRVAARMTGCRAIIHIHDMNFPGIIIGALHRRLARWTDLVVGCSQATCEGAISKFAIPAERVIKLPNAVPVDEYAHASIGARVRVRQELSIDESAAVIAVIGRFVPQKAQDQIIHGMPMILRRRPNAVLVIVGDGSLRGQYEALVKSLGIQRHVRFTGQRRDIPDVLAAVDVVVMPSLYAEGSPMVCIEATVACIPVVGYAIPGIDEVVVDGETGLLVKPGNIEALATALGDVLVNPGFAKKLADGCRHHRDKWGTQSYVRRLEEIYAALVEGRPITAIQDLANRSKL